MKKLFFDITGCLLLYALSVAMGYGLAYISNGIISEPAPIFLGVISMAVFTISVVVSVVFIVEILFKIEPK